VSQRPRHAYPAGIQRGLPGQRKETCREFPPHRQQRDAPRPAPIRQVRAGVKI